MKHLVSTLLIVLTAWTSQGQQFLKEFGKIGKDEIELKQYALDNDAEAVVLLDIAKSYFVQTDNSFDIVFERSTRIKVLSEPGKKWAEVEIPFYQEGNIFERVYDIEAYAYNYENGLINKTSIDLSNTYNEKIDNSWYVKKFAVPNVKEGSIIEYRYKINSQYKFNLRDWEFQWKIPVIYSEYEVKMIPFYEYSFLLQGAKKFDSQKSYIDNGITREFASIKFNDMVHKYTMTDVPAFDSEEFITNISDFIIKLDFQLAKINYPNGSTVDIMTTWDKLIKELNKDHDFGRYLKKSEKVASKSINIKNTDIQTEEEKFEFALDYAKSNFKWNNNYGKFASKSAKKFFEDKHGNCADINLFTIGLLRELGIEAYPVLVSTREHGKIIEDYPFSHFFNYVLISATINEKQFLSDATEISIQNKRIPPRCINDKGLLIREDDVTWIGLKCQFPSVSTTKFETVITDDMKINSVVTKSLTEYDALNYRKNYSDSEKIKKAFETSGYSIIDTTISFSNRLDKEAPFQVKFEQTIGAEIVNKKLLISPFLNQTIETNPLTQKKRIYPVDITYPKRRTFISTIKIPKGYQVEFLPDEQRISNNLFDLAFTTISDGNKINILFDYYFKESVYSSNNYSKIKSYFKEIVRKGNEKIVLSKITDKGT